MVPVPPRVCSPTIDMEAQPGRGERPGEAEDTAEQVDGSVVRPRTSVDGQRPRGHLKGAQVGERGPGEADLKRAALRHHQPLVDDRPGGRPGAPVVPDTD